MTAINKKFIYARVSTVEQNVEQQVAVLQAQWPDATVISDKVSGKGTDRDGFQKLVESMRAGDSILAYDISRLSRNLADLLQFIELCKERGVSLHIYTLGQVDVTSATGAMVVAVLGAVAQMQREEMLEKQTIGIQRARQEGKYKGRQACPETAKKCAYVQYLRDEKGVSVRDAVAQAGVSNGTYWKWVKTQQVGGHISES